MTTNDHPCSRTKNWSSFSLLWKPRLYREEKLQIPWTSFLLYNPPVGHAISPWSSQTANPEVKCVINNLDSVREFTYNAIYWWVTNVWVKYSNSVLVSWSQPVHKKVKKVTFSVFTLVFYWKYIVLHVTNMNFTTTIWLVRCIWPVKIRTLVTSQKDAWSPWLVGWRDV